MYIDTGQKPVYDFLSY